MSKDMKVYGLFGDNITDSKDVMKGQMWQLSKGMNHLFIIVLKDFFYIFLSSSELCISFQFPRILKVTQPYIFSYKNVLSYILFPKSLNLIMGSIQFNLIKWLYLLNSSFLRIMMPLYLPAWFRAIYLKL